MYQKYDGFYGKNLLRSSPLYKDFEMKIIIAGAGEVGFHLSKLLSYESHEIILIDKDLQHIKDGILGDMAPTILHLMGIEKPEAMTRNSLI